MGWVGGGVEEVFMEKFTNIESTSPLLTLWNGIIIYRKGWGGDEVGRNGWGGGRCLRKFHNIMQLALSLHQNYSIYIKYRELFQSP